MRRENWIASLTLALIGACCAAMLPWPSVARADQIADLQAKQDELQLRLSQIAQIPSTGGAYSTDSRSEAAGSAAAGGSFPRSFLIPGTDTSIRIGGQIIVSSTYFLNGGNPNAVPATSSVGNNGALNQAPLHIHNAAPVAGVFPLAGNPARSRSDSIFFLTPEASRLDIETRTPSAWGEARTFMSFDWNNGNSFLPGNSPQLSTNDLPARLRHAYATLGGLLAGQAESNFADPDANSVTLEFGGHVGSPGVPRIPQIRYTQPLAPWALPGALSVSAEAPETEGRLATVGIVGSDAVAVAPAAFLNPFKTPAPDLTAAWYIPQPWGHVDFGGVLRPTLQIKDGMFVDRTYTGWGVHVSGDVKPGWFGWAKDDITWHAVFGDGIGRYLGGTDSVFALATNYPASSPPTSSVAAANVVAKTTVAWGGNAGYEHWLTDTVRIRAGGGILHHDVPTNIRVTAGGAAGTTSSRSDICPSFQIPAGSAGAGMALAGAAGCGLNRELVTLNVNTTWNPVPFVEIGAGYMWGHRFVVSGLKGDVNAVFSRFRVIF
jgi:hypothetical protein